MNSYYIDNPDGLSVCIIEINRPEVKNALNTETMTEIMDVLEQVDNDDSTGCTVITGSREAFSAGADIKEMAEAGAIDIYLKDRFAVWDKLRKIKKPFIAAVSGYALGGGCELAMACDLIIASESAKFGQPEINLAVIPGAGGTQRLTRAVGKGKAMEMILTGKMFSGKEMFDAGLVSVLTREDEYMNEALKTAIEISNKPSIAVQLAKESILKSFELSLNEGIEFERKNFYLLFASEDKFEGMKAFIEKRKPVWKHK
ncbi:MAG: enoyl-CoA hydratase/isomerase family protein [Ignavibacteria bacterium]|nr:enoyl-CoA hydratase/isomerase family protein [Ignavibacteria bacterium]